MKIVPAAYVLISRRFSGEKACSFRPSQAFTVRVNALKSKPSSPKPLKTKQKHAPCEGMNDFFEGIKTVYIRARKAHYPNRWLLLSVPDPPRCPCRSQHEVLFTTPRLLRTTRRVGKTNPGLVRTTPGLVRTTPGLVGRSFHNLKTLEAKRPKSYTPNFPHPKIL